MRTFVVVLLLLALALAAGGSFVVRAEDARPAPNEVRLVSPHANSVSAQAPFAGGVIAAATGLPAAGEASRGHGYGTAQLLSGAVAIGVLLTAAGLSVRRTHRRTRRRR